MSITAWHALITQYFEYYLEEKLDLLGASIIAAQANSETEVPAGSAPFQLDGPLRQLPSSFTDATHEFVERLYHNLPDGFDGPERSSPSATDSEGHNPFLYGEVTSVGVRQVLAEGMKGVDSSRPILFADLGSGTGKMTVELAHLLTNGADASLGASHRFVGIELDSGRAAVAEKAYQLLPRRLQQCVSLQEGDFLQWLSAVHAPGTGLAHDTMVFCCGVGFGQAFVSEICDAINVYRLNSVSNPLRAAVLLFRSHPKDHALYASASRTLAFISTSWMDEAPAMVLRW